MPSMTNQTSGDFDMRPMLIAAVVGVGFTGCATTKPSAPAAAVNSQICLPCVLPCTPEASCNEKASPSARVAVTKERIELKEKIHFDTGEATIKPVSYGLLDEVASTLKAHPELKRTEIEGHTDSQGEAELNKQLSRRRAEAVREYLIQKGVDGGRLGATGYGAERPVAPNDTDQGREANRRGEFRITK